MNKVAGLTDERANIASVPPSTLTPAGLVRHLAGVERFWLAIDFSGLDLPWPSTDDEEEDDVGAFRSIGEGERLADVIAAYREDCGRANEIIADAGLDDRAQGEDMNFTLRHALAHMIEETARHCGHLDLLREAIDGQRGE